MSNNEQKRDIVFFDLETTGTNLSKDRIVQIAIKKIFADGRPTESKDRLIFPEIAIPKEATAVHGITNIKVRNEPPFRDIAKSLHEYLSGCDLGGYNIMSFDIPLLNQEFNRCGLFLDIKSVNIYDVYLMYCKINPRTLEAVYKRYIGSDLEGAHDAMKDTNATIEIFNKMVSTENELSSLSWEQLSDFCVNKSKIVDLAGMFSMNENGQYIFGFGKHKGNVVSTEKSYLSWMIDKGEFTEDTKEWAKKFLAQ